MEFSNADTKYHYIVEPALGQKTWHYNSICKRRQNAKATPDGVHQSYYASLKRVRWQNVVRLLNLICLCGSLTFDLRCLCVTITSAELRMTIVRVAVFFHLMADRKRKADIRIRCASVTATRLKSHCKTERLLLSWLVFPYQNGIFWYMLR